MKRKAIIEIEDPASWHLLQAIFNNMFDCSMLNVRDPRIDPANDIGVLTFRNITVEGYQYLKDHNIKHPDLKNIGLDK